MILIAAPFMVVPFVWQILTLFKTTAEVTRIPPTILPRGLSLHSFETFFSTVPFWSMFAVSTGSLTLRVIGQIVVAALAGYAFARIPFRGRSVLFGLFIVMLMVPSQLFLIGQYGLIRDLKLLDTLPALAIPGLFSAFGTFLMRQAFLTMPNDYEEAARLDGANPFQVFWHVMLPMARPTRRRARRTDGALLLERPALAADRLALRGEPAAAGGPRGTARTVRYGLPDAHGGCARLLDTARDCLPCPATAVLRWHRGKWDQGMTLEQQTRHTDPSARRGHQPRRRRRRRPASAHPALGAGPR